MSYLFIYVGVGYEVNLVDPTLSEHCFLVACRLYDNVLVGTVNFNTLTSCRNDFRLCLGTGYETVSS